MENRFLHIIAFNVPYPPDYGGVIDIFYKIKALSENGVRVILHCFTYGRQSSKELEAICFRVYYYRRKSGLRYFLNRIPYITVTRQAKFMPERLLEDQFPVLFEGIHSTLYLDQLGRSGKRLIVRTHNVEHEYYRQLAASEKKPFTKFFLYSEALKLKAYEAVLKKADLLLAISEKDKFHFSSFHPDCIHIPAFHPAASVDIEEGSGDYILYHGNLSVAENQKAALYLIEKVFRHLDIRVIIAGKDPTAHLQRKASRYENITLIANPGNFQMDELVRNAQVHLLYTFQATGIKLKLLHTLFKGRHCIVNPHMVDGSALADACHIADNAEETLELINKLMQLPFTEADIRSRRLLLEPYSNRINAEKLVRLIYRGG